MKLLAFHKITALMELINEVRTNCLYDAMKTNVGVIGIAALICNLITRWGDCQIHTQTNVPPENNPQFSLHRRLDGPQSWTGQFGFDYTVQNYEMEQNYQFSVTQVPLHKIIF
jgi:hypothetical protein